MKFGLYWEDVPFPNLVSNNACDYTTCPVQAGQSQSLVYSLPIGKKLPKVSKHIVFFYFLLQYIYAIIVSLHFINYKYTDYQVIVPLDVYLMITRATIIVKR